MFTIIADALPRFMQCTGSRSMPADFPNREPGEQTVRDQGIAVHWLAQQVEQHRLTLEYVASTPTTAPNGVLLTSEMIDHVGEFLGSFTPGESECATSWQGTTVPGATAYHIAGRADRIEWDGTTVRVRDLKYGWRTVEPEENWTLLSHAIGFVEARGITSCNVELIIHQPRPHHPDGKVREWRTNYAQLHRYKAAILARIDDAQTLETGPLCGNCHANASCPAYRKAGYNAIDTVENTVFSDDISDALLAHELRLMERAEAVLKDRKSALEEMAQHRIGNGAIVEGFSLEHRYGNRVWNDGLSADALRALTGVDLTKPGTVTPAEAERRGVPKEIVAMMTHKPNLGVKLAKQKIDAKARRLLT